MTILRIANGGILVQVRILLKTRAYTVIKATMLEIL